MYPYMLTFFCAPIYIYIYTYFFSHILIHDYILLCHMRPINVYVFLRPYTNTWLHISRPCYYTCLYTSTPLYLYIFTHFYAYTTVHVYKLLCPYAYASLITSTSIYLYILLYFYGHILINGFILLHVYALYLFTYINVHMPHTTFHAVSPIYL